MTRLVYALSMPMLVVAVLVASSLPRSHPAAVEFLPHGIVPICDGNQAMQSSRARRSNKLRRQENATVSVLEFLAAAGVVVDLLAQGTYPTMQSRIHEVAP
jgi:hypothetical protein